MLTHLSGGSGKIREKVGTHLIIKKTEYANMEAAEKGMRNGIIKKMREKSAQEGKEVRKMFVFKKNLENCKKGRKNERKKSASIPAPKVLMRRVNDYFRNYM